ncbi:hypothetical protein VTK73DRAFT_2575 [Phialemonium thermophilum]|uniref:Aminoglycoside phosphotransferase domain-containing protein n=1 Tax=Phialemonium thermophilum TaxID=223376 RepID=A0ABR3VRZ3_9PEZI
MQPQSAGSDTSVQRKRFSRLDELYRQERLRAALGDAPVELRVPGPPPEGVTIHQLRARSVIRHGDSVTKLTTSPLGITPNEAAAMRFVRQHTSIPVPEVRGTDWDRITMEYVEGETLHDAWPKLGEEDKAAIRDQLRDYIQQLRSLQGLYVGRLDGIPAQAPGLFQRSGGPFRTVAEFHQFLLGQTRVHNGHRDIIRRELKDDYAIVFTHCDLAPRNIIVRDARIVAVIDWEMAGWYPEYWEYALMIRAFTSVGDWDGLGRHLPYLFPRRYDYEYILTSHVGQCS